MPTLPDLPQTEIAIIEMTNAFRKEQRQGELKPNAALRAAARAFAEYLGNTGKFAHEADGREPMARAEAMGYRACLVSENLALNLDSRGFETRKLARDVVEGWKASPSHRSNMLEASATEIGVGVARARDRNPKFISVQVFGRPESLKVVFAIENRSGGAVNYSLGEEREALPPGATATHTSCEAAALVFDQAEPAWRRLEPKDGDSFVVSRGRLGALRVERHRR
ncbi:MAG TPA: CAP domain-containing protein [Hyphomicrobiaceae bacterium]|nr:CAP domain-containing protein [Hyphomicrobiaceae bacterium]